MILWRAGGYVWSSSVGGTAGGRAGYGSVMVGGISVVVGVCVVVECGERRPTEKKERPIIVCPYLLWQRLAVLTFLSLSSGRTYTNNIRLAVLTYHRPYRLAVLIQYRLAVLTCRYRTSVYLRN